MNILDLASDGGVFFFARAHSNCLYAKRADSVDVDNHLLSTCQNRLLLYGETIQNVKILPAWLVGYAVAVAGLATKNLLLRFGL